MILHMYVIHNKLGILHGLQISRTPLDIACKLGHVDMVKYLIEAGAPLEKVSSTCTSCDRVMMDVDTYLQKRKYHQNRRSLMSFDA